MKKLFALILALVMVLSLAACGGDKDNTVAGENTEPTNNTTGTVNNSTESTQGTTEDTTETNPPATEPPATNPPATTPPATTPVVTTPPATNPPATTPATTEPKPTEPEVNNNQNQQAAYEKAVTEINTEYNRLVAETQKEHNNNLFNLASAKLEAESEIGALRSACLSELNSLSNQKNALVREKDRALANALANTGGQYNSYYDSLKKQYDSRIASVDNQIAQTNSKYGKKIAEWETYINNLPTVADYEYLRDLKLKDIEKWKNEQIQNAKSFYGIS